MDTTQFYKNVAADFSKTRQSPWPGWEKVWEHIQQANAKSIADLGCGNGRFLKFLQTKGYTGKYTGYDNNDYFLQEASVLTNTKKFINKDIFLDLNSISEKFDVVVGFGITHHFTQEIRQTWFTQVGKLLNTNGLLILSFWEYDQDYRIGTEKIADQDWLLDFNNTGNKRYFHKYTHDELAQLLANYVIKSEFVADGKNNNLNRYLILSARS